MPKNALCTMKGTWLITFYIDFSCISTMSFCCGSIQISMSLRCCSIHISISSRCCSSMSIFFLLLASWFSCIFYNIFMFTLSVARFWDSLTKAFDATSYGISGSSRALCLRLSLLSAIYLLLHVLDILGGSDGNDNKGRFSYLGSDGLG